MECAERTLCARLATTGLIVGAHQTSWETDSPDATPSVPDTTTAIRTKLVSNSSAEIPALSLIPTSAAKELTAKCATTNQFAPAHEGSPEILSNPVGNSPLKICANQTHVEKAPSALQATTDPDLIVQFVCAPQALEETRFRDVPKASVLMMATVAPTGLATTLSVLTLAMMLAELRPSARL